jgi:hypothetical protein
MLTGVESEYTLLSNTDEVPEVRSKAQLRRQTQGYSTILNKGEPNKYDFEFGEGWQDMCTLNCGSDPVTSLKVFVEVTAYVSGPNPFQARVVLESQGVEVHVEFIRVHIKPDGRPDTKFRKTYLKQDEIVAKATNDCVYKFQFNKDVSIDSCNDVFIHCSAVLNAAPCDDVRDISSSVRSLVNKWTLAGITNFSFMPVAFACSYFGKEFVTTSLIGAQALVGFCSQLILAKMSRDITLRHLRQLSLDPHGHDVEEMNTPDLCSRVLGNVQESMAAFGRVPYNLFKAPLLMELLRLLMDLPEFWDPVTDSAAAGSAKRILTEEANDVFVESYSSVPLISSIVDAFGLQGVLCLFLGIATTVQLAFFACSVIKVRYLMGCLPDQESSSASDLPTSYLSSILCDMAKGSVTSSLVYLSKVQESLYMAIAFHGKQQCTLNEVEKGSEWVKAGTKGILESVPSTWFTTSLLGLSLHFHPGVGALTMRMNVVSIVVSIATMLQAGFSAIMTKKNSILELLCQS